MDACFRMKSCHVRHAREVLDARAAKWKCIRSDLSSYRSCYFVVMVQMLVRNLFFVNWFVFLLWSLNYFMVHLNWLLYNFLRVMHRLVNFLLNCFFLFDDCRFVVHVNRFEQGMNVFLLLHFNWNVNDDLSVPSTVKKFLQLISFSMEINFQLTPRFRSQLQRWSQIMRSAEN